MMEFRLLFDEVQGRLIHRRAPDGLQLGVHIRHPILLRTRGGGERVEAKWEGREGGVYVCVCVCVRERERVRERGVGPSPAHRLPRTHASSAL
jgi:hypothetical protein